MMVRSHRDKLLVLTIEIFLYQIFAVQHFLPDHVQKINILINSHLKDEEDNYPVIHTFIDRKVRNDWSTWILRTYSKQVPISLFHTDAEINKFASSNKVKLYYVIGIFEHVEDVDLRKWKEAVGDRWNPRGRFIIWIIGRIYHHNHCKVNNSIGYSKFRNCIRCPVPETTLDSKEKLFTKLWLSEASANVVIITFNKTTGDFEQSGYDPFYLNHDNRRGIMYPILEGKKVFPEKFMNLHGYPIRISMFQKPPFVELMNQNTEMKRGEDVEFFRLLQSSMNFSIELLSDNCTAADYGIDLPNGDSVGIIGDILLNRSEVLGNSRFMNTASERNVECLYPFGTGTYSAIVPYQKPVLDFNIIGQNWFNYKTILNIAPVFFLAIYLYSRRERYPLFSTWRVIINLQFRNIGKKNSDRIVKITWIIYAVLINCVFEVHLVELLTKPYRQHQINTLADLNSSNLTLMVGDKMIDLIAKSSIPLRQDLAKKTKTNLNYSLCSERLLKNGDVACASDKLSSYLSLAELWGGYNNTHKVHLMTEPIGHFWLSYVVRKNLPYLDRFEIIQRRMLEAGLKTRMFENNRNSVRRHFLIKTEKRENETIQMWHLKSTCFICLALMGLAFLAFLYELYFGRKRIKMKKWKASKKLKRIAHWTLIKRNKLKPQPFRPFIL